LLKEYVEQELEENITQTVSSCINSFVSGARIKGYEVSSCNLPVFSVNLSQSKISVPITCAISLTKGQESKRFEKFEPSFSWPLFEFVMLSSRIILDEQQTGTFDYVTFMQVPMNGWVEVNLFRINDNIKIYSLYERATNKEFTFAVSSWS
jgi:hypothetical protein